MDQNQLAAQCGSTYDAAKRAIEWVASESENANVVAMREQLLRELRKFSNHSAMLQRAVGRPMCVGLFGESQAGKSYLAGGLSRTREAPLRIVFDGEEDKDFITQINPGGNKESTGIVTRFSIRPLPHPQGYPVCLRLLTETDIIKIFGNTYFLDSDPKTFRPMASDKLESILDDVRRRASQATPGMNAEQVWSVQEYFQKQFNHLPPMQALTSYWAEAENLAPRLDTEGRAILFSPLWGGHEKLTNLFGKLISALNVLGSSQDVFAKIDALIPRRTSIIDVETLLGLSDPNSGTLEVSTMAGLRATLPRPIVTALTAELHLVIREKPWDFFDHTDLLDFPGAKNRDPVDMDEFLEKNEDSLKQLIVRGKVAFLFDRYVAEQELTSMLLVLKPSNQNITSLTSLVAEWIERTHGKTAADRERAAATLLFLVFSWFNDEIKLKPGEPEPNAADPLNERGERFRSRMVATFPNFFAKSYDWPNNWTPGKPFQNSLWLRDPQYSRETYEVDPVDGKEKLRDGQHARIDKLKEGYLKVDEIHKYFKDPGRAWDEAIKGDDGGVSYLASSLKPVCEPEMKRRQIAAQMSDMRREMKQKLEQFHISDDLTKRRDERRAVIGEVLNSIDVTADMRTFTRLLRLLQVDERLLSDHMYRVNRKRATEPVSTETPRPKGRNRFGGIGSPSPAAQAANTPVRDRMNDIADEMVSAWATEIGLRAENDRIMRELHMPSAHMLEIVAEIVGGARRLKLADQLADCLRRFHFPEASDRVLQRNAVIAANQINSFVAGLGYSSKPLTERPTRPGHSGDMQPIFLGRSFVSAQIELSPEIVAEDETLVADWGYGLLALTEDNASSTDGRSINLARNKELGEIIDGLTD